MARIRTIKPEFFISLSTADLSLTARLTFVGLWTHCDDEGRCIYDARLIRAAIWPLDDRSIADVESDLDELALSEDPVITIYEVGKRRYLMVNHWTKHQYINRPTPSKFPAPGTTPKPPVTRENGQSHGALTEDSVSVHGGLTPGKERKGKEQGTGIKDTRDEVSENASMALVSVAPTAPCLSTGFPFEAFWTAYPRHVGKPKARAAYSNACRRAPPSSIVEGAVRYALDPNRLEQFTAYPTTWLNRDGWNDPPLPARQGSQPNQQLTDRLAGLREWQASWASETA